MQVGHDGDYVRNKIKRLCPSTVALSIKIKPWTWLREKTGALIKQIWDLKVRKWPDWVFQWLVFMFSTSFVFTYRHDAPRTHQAGRLRTCDWVQSLPRQAGPAGCQQAQSAAHRHTPMQWHWDAKAAACLHKSPPFLLLWRPHLAKQWAQCGADLSGPAWRDRQSAGAAWFALEWMFTAVGGRIVFTEPESHTNHGAPSSRRSGKVFTVWRRSFCFAQSAKKQSNHEATISLIRFFPALNESLWQIRRCCHLRWNHYWALLQNKKWSSITGSDLNALKEGWEKRKSFISEKKLWWDFVTLT